MLFSAIHSLLLWLTKLVLKEGGGEAIGSMVWLRISFFGLLNLRISPPPQSHHNHSSSKSDLPVRNIKRNRRNQHVLLTSNTHTHTHTHTLHSAKKKRVQYFIQEASLDVMLPRILDLPHLFYFCVDRAETHKIGQSFYGLTQNKLQHFPNQVYLIENSYSNNISKVYQNRSSGTMCNLHKFKMAAIQGWMH